MENQNKEPFMPRVKVLGDTCSSCGTRIRPNQMLLKIRCITQVGYLDTEICPVCFLRENKDDLKELIEELFKE